MGKKPLTKEQIQQIRILVKGKPLHELLLNLGIDLMLRTTDLRSLKVSDVMNPSGTAKESVSVKQLKTGKRTLSMPLMVVLRLVSTLLRVVGRQTMVVAVVLILVVVMGVVVQLLVDIVVLLLVVAVVVQLSVEIIVVIMLLSVEVIVVGRTS